jgi:MFS family permease
VSGTAGEARAASLWRHGDFLKLWSAQSISLIGTQVTALALPLTAILKLNASPLQVGLLGSLQYLPFLLVSLPAGAIVDRLRQLPVLVATDLARAALLIAVPVAAWCGQLTLGLLYPIAFLVGVLSVFFDVAHQSYLPALVEPGQLVEGNTKLQLSYSGAQLTGPGLGGMLVQALTAPIAIVVDAASFLGSAALLSSIRRGNKNSKPETSRAARGDLRGLGHDIGEGLGFVWRHPLIRPLALATGTSNFFYLFGMTGTVLTIYAVRELRLTPALLGAVLAVGNAGAIAGSLIADRVLDRWRFGYVMIAGSVVSAVAVALMALATRGSALILLSTAVLVRVRHLHVQHRPDQPAASLDSGQAARPDERHGPLRELGADPAGRLRRRPARRDHRTAPDPVGGRSRQHAAGDSTAAVADPRPAQAARRAGSGG